MSTAEPVVVDDPVHHRFEVRLDGVVAGFAAYVDVGDERIFHHTEIGDAFGGRGLGGVLVRAALTATRDAGLRIVAVCPYVAKWLSAHAEEAELVDAVDPVTREALDAVTQATA